MSRLKEHSHVVPRVTLTKAQSATAVGQELIRLLSEIVKDGLVTEEGFHRLEEWLDGRSEPEVPAVGFLARLASEKQGKGEFTLEDAFDLESAVERVLPKHVREGFTPNRPDLWPLQPATESQIQYIYNLGGTPGPNITKQEAAALIKQLQEQLRPRATEKQLAFIRELGGRPPPNISKRSASELIDYLLWQEDLRPTPRQVMILRFWNRMDLATGARGRITEWLEAFYREDPRRKLAWERFRAATRAESSGDDPSCVPIGAGETYLQDVASEGPVAPTRAPAYCSTGCPYCGAHLQHEPYNPDVHSRWLECPECGSAVDLVLNECG